MKLRQYIFLGIGLFILFTFVGCNTSQPLNVTAIQETIPIAQPDRPRPLRLNSISFKVVSASNLEEFIQEFQLNPNRRWYIISPSDYQRMIENIADMRRYIQQQERIIVYYENITRTDQTSP